ncbi:phage antirepressor KilAC domain-containing protein [Nocardia wallacei]|uniref:phage antirepressor KilAC domain-containing protein n=1 Tax=Nocardia wallacei TaxID=480035 RepID=UPI002455ECF0|nr:phage antirepressor KilAC domain-containing protein [Nocardia wallacei]
MTADLMPFAYEGATVRTLVINGEPWFVMADLCAALGMSNPAMTARRIDEADVSQAEISSGGQRRSVTIVSESGMYEVVIRSDKPGAVAFRRWITSEVLPAIRKTGGYGRTVERLTPLEYARQLVAAEERAESERAGRIEAERFARQLYAPASAWSHLAESSGDYEVADAAKVLSRDPGISIGRDRLFAFMAAEGWIFRNRATARWKAYQTQVDNGRLTEKLGRPYLHEPTGEMRNPDPTIRITAKGMAELHKRLGGMDQLPTLAATS